MKLKLVQKELSIIIFDGSFKTTPFINRLAEGLAIQHKVFILGFNNKLITPVKEVRYVHLGSNQNNIRFFFITISHLINSGRFSIIFPTLKKLMLGDRKALQQQNLHLAIENISPDIIHLQWPSVIPWFEKLLVEQKSPVILSQRGFHSNVRPFIEKENFEYLKEWYPKMAGFHSVSKAISENGDKIWNSPTKIDKTVYTGLPQDNFAFAEEFYRSTPLKLISVGRAHWKKGYDYALLACRLLKDRNINFRYKIIGGAGDEELLFLVHNFGLQDNVQLLGRIPQAAVFKEMGEASVLLMPSLEEGLPNVIVEAMTVGLPVISTNCGGVPELIDDGQDGWLVPTRNPLAMAGAIEAFTHLPLEKIKEVRLAARTKVEKQHNLKKMVEGMEELYYEVIKLNKA